LITLENISKTYSAAGGTVEALKNVSLEIGQGEFFALAGASGSGKTTLMNILGCLDRPDSGRYLFRGRDVSKLSSAGLASIRRAHIGFVFQTFNLLSRLSALENVELPLVYNGVPPSVRRELARRALRLVGLEDRAAHRPCQLSGGQQQRAAFARAIVTSPKLLLADEPTANLDRASSGEILKLLASFHQRGGTVILVTHDAQAAGLAQKVFAIEDGILAAR
jgi:putative ABC transport system ATP-binding protein